MQTSPAIDKVWGASRTELDLGPSDPIDASKVGDQLLAQLDDSVMDRLVPNQQQNEWMDQLMGVGIVGSYGMMGNGCAGFAATPASRPKRSRGNATPSTRSS